LVGDLLNREVRNKTTEGKRIAECFAAHKLGKIQIQIITVTAIVDDEIVINLVKGEIDRCEEASQSWLVAGFPRTKVQALSLQRLKVIPDKFIHMSIRPSHSVQKKKQKIHDEHPSVYGEELDRIASQIYSDYEMNIN